MRSADDFEELEILVAERGGALMATATLLAGGRTAGEDLLQAALERVLRRAMYHLAVDHWRARRRRPEVLGRTVAQLDVDQWGHQPDPTETLELRQALIQGLSQLPPRQRAVLVLRYWEQLNDAETAALLGCSVGTVKSSASRGLARLRTVTAAWTAEQAPDQNGIRT